MTALFRSGLLSLKGHLAITFDRLKILIGDGKKARILGGIRGDFITAVEFNTHEKERGMRRGRGRERGGGEKMKSTPGA